MILCLLMSVSMSMSGWMLSFLLFVWSVGASSWIDNYNTIWTEPGVTAYASLPIGNGDLVANVWLNQTIANETANSSTGYSIYLLFAKSDAYDLTGQRLKVLQSKISLDPPILYTARQFRESLLVSNGTIVIETDINGGADDNDDDDDNWIKLWIDSNSNTLNVDCGSYYTSMTIEIESWRKENNFDIGKATGDVVCHNPNSIPILKDNIINYDCNSGNGGSSGNNDNSDNNGSGILFYHRNNWNGSTISQFQIDFIQQGLNINGDISQFDDELYNLTFGAYLQCPQTTAVNINGIQCKVDSDSNRIILVKDDRGDYSRKLKHSSGSDTSLSAQLHFLTQKKTKTLQEWIDNICDMSIQYDKKSPINIQQDHNQIWYDFWNRSWVEIYNSTSSSYSNSAAMESGGVDNSSVLYLVTQEYNYQRYLNRLDGKSQSNYSINHNGQSFTIDVGQGPDYRQWGASFWWQNIRQPYYSSIASNDSFEFNIAFYNHLLNQLKIGELRNKLYYNHSGAYLCETAQHSGLYSPGQYGIDCANYNLSSYTFDPFSINPWIRFHWVGGLELINLMIDDYLYFGNKNIITNYIKPFSNDILHHYYYHFKINSTTNKLDIFPAQALETWQCHSLTNRSDCVTNPTEQISGLKTVTRRLLNEIDDINSYFNQSELNFVQLMHDITPDLPIITSSNGVKSVNHGLMLPPSSTNSENPELYTVHPFKIFQWFKSNLTLGINTYNQRLFPCNDGWCQDILDTALLGLVNETKEMLINRAVNSKDGFNWKWNGFAGHFQDYEPATDHLSWMRTAIHYMLMQNDFDNDVIYLLPTWPCDWSVKFKLYAINQTMIELDYNGDTQTVNSLIVVPSQRQKNVKFANCVSS